AATPRRAASARPWSGAPAGWPRPALDLAHRPGGSLRLRARGRASGPRRLSSCGRSRAAGAADAPRTDARPGLRAGPGPVCDRNLATELPPRPVAPRLLVLAGLGPLRPLAHGSVDGMGNADPPPHLRPALQPGLGRGDRPLLHPSAPRGRAVGAGAEAKLEAVAPRRADDGCGVHGISSRVAGDPGPPRRAGLSCRDAS